MNLKSPTTMQLEHDELHQNLAQATKLAGPVGEASRQVAKVLHAHFLEEEKYATPLLGLLPDLIEGKISEDLTPAMALADTLKQKLPTMLAEHQEIIAALKGLIAAARATGNLEYQTLAEKIIFHAKHEEEVIYPTALLIGKYLKIKKGP